MPAPNAGAGVFSQVLPFYRPDSARYFRSLRGDFFYVFTDLSASPTTSGGSIFRCTTKDRGERRAKGVATPFNPLGFMRDRKPDVLWFYLLATVQLTRLSRLRCREANALGVRCRLFPCLCVLRCGGKVCTPATTQLPSLQNLGYSLSANNFTRSWCSTERQGNKRSAAADLIASIALRRTRRKVRTSPLLPPYKSKIPKGGFGALWRVFLRYLSSRKERYRPRRALDTQSAR